MLAAFFKGPGAPNDVLEVGEVLTPKPGAGELLVEMKAAGINPFDTKLLDGYYHFVEHLFQVIPLNDGAGVIDQVGEGVSQSRVGERVWVRNVSAGSGKGCAAQFVVVPEAKAQPLPDNISFEVGASLGVPLVTAWYNVEFGGDMTGKNVLITGGAGSVGHYAVQIAKRKDAVVFTTVSGDEKADHAAKAGADHIINYRTENVAEKIMDLTGGKGIDFCAETNLSANGALYPAIMAPKSRIAAYGTDGPEVTLPIGPLLGKQIDLQFTTLQVLTPEQSAEMSETVNGFLKDVTLIHTVGASFPLAQAGEAYQAVMDRKFIGKIVLTL